MKITFNPSTVAALIAPPNNKDITFDLRGRNIFARGVKFCGTDTNTWRDIKINNVSIGSNILDLRNGSNTTLTNTNGVVTINSTWRPVVDNLTSDSTTSSLSAKQGKILKSLIDGKSNSGHTHDDRYVKKSGDTMSGVLTIDTTNFGALTIKRNDDANGASIQFRGKSSVYGYIGLNNSTKDKQFLRWNSDTSKIYTILDTSSTYTSNGKGVINGTTITQVDNATNSTNSTNARKLVNWYSARPTSLNTQFGDGSLRIFYATSYTTKGKPAEDSHILHLAWDNNSGYDAQLAVHTCSGKVSTRAQNSGTWQPWKTLAFTTDIPSSLKNPYSFNVFGVTYDGSAAKTITTSTFISQLSEGTSAVTDGTMFITSYASDSGFADTNAVNVPYKRKASCLWSYIDSKVSSKYLPLAGGTMNGNARIGHGSGNLYIGNSGNDGWIYTQDIASQRGTDKWAVRTFGAAHFGNVYICTKNDYITYGSSIIECYNDALYLNYYSSTKVILCKGGGSVGIGTVPSYKLDVKGQAQAEGFRHSSHNSDDAVLLAGGGYSQGVPVRYWAIYQIYIGGGPNDISWIKRSGNHNFITSYDWQSEGSVTLQINFPPGYNKTNTLIFGNGDHQISHNFTTPVYVTIITDTDFGSASEIRVLLSNDSSLDTGYANIYFMCMG